jgi:2-oxoacid:acceptor oxidoreductase gamma subunit (pyruvate/2-ketoisovalerate family)/2-oxoacid:acceptor oxidoreductase delta subunit (pyruvate/2-ketoisovalerate family)
VEARFMGELRIHGRGGQGTVIAAEMLANAFVRAGKYASVFPSFGVERRGSAVTAFARFADQPVREHTRVYRPDIVLLLDQSLGQSAACYEGFKTGGMVIASTAHRQHLLEMNLKQGVLATVDGARIATEETGTPITNTCMLGAFARATGLVQLSDLKEALGSYLKGHVLVKNLRCMERGFEEAEIVSFPQSAEVEEKLTRKPSDTVKAPPMLSPFESPWVDVDKKLMTVHTGEWRYRRPELNKIACRLCGWCSIYCPVGCLATGEDKYYHPNLDYCKGCGVCANECPAKAISMRPEEVI